MPLARRVYANSIHPACNNRSRWWIDRRFGVLAGLTALLVLPVLPQKASAQAVRVTCVSRIGGRSECPADTAKGIVLAKAFGEAPCVLGKTWGFDEKGIWVYDGCSGDFLAGPNTPQESIKKGKAEYIPNAGFLLYEGEKGEIYMRLFSYARYLNQKGLDPTYTDSFGNTFNVKQREDFQLNKFFLPFSGWFLTPKFRYYLYVWSTNVSQGDPAQVVGAGNLSYVFNRYVTAGAGITSLPSVRSTEGQFPYWLGVDDRLIADEFFRGSYTTGIWIKGQAAAGINYMAMLANNLSTLGVSAAQLDNKIDTYSLSLNWLPTTKEFGLYGTFGDYDYHKKVATRLGIHFTHSTEDKQSQPGQNAVENSQIRLTDGSVIFTPDLFGPGITVEKARYRMSSIDGGVKFKGLSLEAEYYWRWLDHYQGLNVGGIPNFDDHGFQVQASAMAIKDLLQVYGGGSGIYGVRGNGSEFRLGTNFYPVKQRGFRINAEWMHMNDVPVGYTAVPYAVGSSGNIFHTNLELNF